MGLTLSDFFLLLKGHIYIAIFFFFFFFLEKLIGGTKDGIGLTGCVVPEFLAKI